MNMELWAATFLRFAALLHFIFLPFFSGRSIPAMAKVTVGLALSITVAIKWMSLTSRQFGTLRLCRNANCNGLSLSKIVEMLWNIPKWPGIF